MIGERAGQDGQRWADGALGLVETVARSVSQTWRAIQEWAPKALHVMVDNAVALAAAGLAVMVAMALVRVGLRGVALRRRVSYAVLPSSGFAPSMEEILRVTHMLTRSRPASRWLTPRDALAVRVRLTSAGEGRLVQILEGPARSDSVLRQAGYDQVELRRVESLLDTRRDDETATAGRGGSERGKGR